MRVATIAEPSATAVSSHSATTQTSAVGLGAHTTSARVGPTASDSSLKTSPLVSSGVDAAAEKVLRSFNTWAFKREQPSDAHLMLRFIAEAISLREPIPFALYWGKGPRNEAGAPDAQCLDFIAALAARVKAVYPVGTAVRLILTDTHAELNGHAACDADRYFEGIEKLAAQRNMRACRLGALVKAAGDLGAAAPIEEIVSEQMLTNLIASARKWYRGDETAEEGALRYLRMNMIEQRVVERAFPGTIFITFNGSDLRALFPRQLPIFYMYSLRRGFGVKPWFLSADGRQIAFTGETGGRSEPS